MDIYFVSKLEDAVYQTPHNTGGSLCSGGQYVGYIGADGVAVHAKDDADTWSNYAHCGPWSGMQSGTPLPVPADALATFSGWWDTINDGRVSLRVNAVTLRGAVAAAKAMAEFRNLHWWSMVYVYGDKAMTFAWDAMVTAKYATQSRLAARREEREYQRRQALEQHKAMRIAHKKAMETAAMNPLLNAMAQVGL